MNSEGQKAHHEDDQLKPELDASGEKKVEEEEAPNATITFEVIRRDGEWELGRPASALFWSALAGGMSMGFSFVAEALLRSHLPDAEWTPLLTKLGYPVGFLIISLGSQQLFTENTITPIVPLLVKRTGEMFRRVLLLWAVVLVGNLVGALAFATFVGLTDAFEPGVRAAFAAIGHEALRGGFATTLVRGVFAGWLIALLMWMLPSAAGQQVGTIVLMTYLVGLGGLSHVIAGSVAVLYLVVTGQVPIATYLEGFLIPALLGNVIGGLTLVTWLNHAQVASGGGQKK